MHISYLSIYAKNYCRTKQVTSHNGMEHAQNTEVGDSPPNTEGSRENIEYAAAGNRQRTVVQLSRPLSVKAAYCKMLQRVSDLNIFFGLT